MKKKERVKYAKKWLRWIAVGNILMLLQRIPYLGNILALPISIINIVAMIKLRRINQKYQKALHFMLYAIGALLLACIAWVESLRIEAFLIVGLVLFALYLALNIKQIHYFFGATSDLLMEQHEKQVANESNIFWKIAAIGAVVPTLFFVLSLLFPGKSGVFSFGQTLALPLQTVPYIVFLFKCDKALEKHTRK